MKMKPIIIDTEEKLLEYKGKPMTLEEEARAFIAFLDYLNPKPFITRVIGDPDYEETNNSDKEDT